MPFTIKLRNQFIKIYIKKYLHINIRSTRIYDQRNYYKIRIYNKKNYIMIYTKKIIYDSTLTSF